MLLKPKDEEVFTEKCLKFKCEMDTVMAPFTEVYKDMQNKAKQTKITFFTKSDDPDDPKPKMSASSR